MAFKRGRMKDINERRDDTILVDPYQIDLLRIQKYAVDVTDLIDYQASVASTATGEGAALVGIEDAAGNYTGETVEAALTEIGTALGLIGTPVQLKGTWDASIGSFPGGGSALAGWSYLVDGSGTVDGVAFTVGDRLICIFDNASTSTYAGNWYKADYTDLVSSVAGRTGAVTLAQADISGLTTSDSPQFTNETLTGYQDFTEISAPSAPGANLLRVWAEDNNGISVLHFKSDLGVDHQLGRDLLAVVRNDTGSTLTTGQVVYISGSNGTTPRVSLARSDSASTMPGFGIVVADISTNGFGQVCFAGDVRGLNTSGWSAGDTLYVDASTAGSLTNTPPSGANIPQKVGIVVTSNPSQGVINVIIGAELNPALTQTLTNKTVNLTSNTLTGTQAEFDAACSDGNFVYTDDIGVSVQGYDADTAKYDDVTANFTGTLQNDGSNVLVDSDIGSTVQAYDADLTTWAGITPGTGVATFLATPSSANLASAVTDETGSGALVFGTSPGFTTAANPASNDGATLGTTSLKWSDLFLASGGVINFNSGDVTITHSTNTLTFAGATSGYAFNNGSLATSGSFTAGSGAPSAARYIYIDAQAGQTTALGMLRSGGYRWEIGGGGAETGSNAGCDLYINSYSDAGGYLTTPFSIIRATGNATFGANLAVGGALSKGSGSFRIPHPLPELADTHDLVHSFVEGPRADNIYRGRAQLAHGRAIIDIDEDVGMTPGTFTALNHNPQVWVSNDTGWARVRGRVYGGDLLIECEDDACCDSVSWLVVAERHDETIKRADWTDDDGRPVLEPTARNGRSEE